MNYMIVVILWFLSTINVVVFSQENTNKDYTEFLVNESLSTITDRKLYVGGETIWFKTHCFNREDGKLSDFSKVANLELISANGGAVLRVKIELVGGLGIGNFDIPSDLPNGTYIIRSYTQAMRNFGVQGFNEISILVLNPDQSLVKSTEGLSYEKASLKEEKSDELEIVLEMSKTSYSQRSRVDVSITTFDSNRTPVSASLVLSAVLGASQNFLSVGQPMSDFPRIEVLRKRSDSLGMKFPPEVDGIQLRGKVVNDIDKAGIEKALVFLSFPGSHARVYARETNELGHFNFLLPKTYGLRQIIVQAQTDTIQQFSIQIADEYEPIKSGNPIEFSLSESLWSLANNILENAQIQSAYKAFEVTPQFTRDDPFKEIPFFGAPYKHYNLDDYTRFPLPEFFYEVVSKVRVNGKFGNEKLKLVNEWEPTTGEVPPLLLVDGVPVFDQATFLKINNKLIQSADILLAPYWLNPVIFDGIIAINSIDNDARSFTLPESAIRQSFLALQPKRGFYAQDYSTDANKRLPDFRNTLYWNPTITTDDNGKASIHFYTSDAIGQYEITVSGTTKTGLVGSSQRQIDVSRSLK